MCWSLVVLFFIFLIIMLVAKKILWNPEKANLHCRHVLITGGSSGIGKSSAIEVAKLGAHVTVVARDKKKLTEAVDEIKKVAKNPEIQKIQFISLDVTTSYEVVNETLMQIEEFVGPIFLLINCAGMAICDEFENLSETNLRYMMNLNYFGTVFPTLAVAKRMKTRKEGHIVITGSQASLLGIFGMSAYCASKFALRGFAESLYMELKPHNVSVTVCLPPDTNTPGFETEEKSKPEITRLISETAGLFEPQVVANRLISDALSGRFFSAVGLEGFMLTTLCAGMTPTSSVSDAFLEICLMSIFRLVSFGYLFHFQRIVLNKVKTIEKTVQPEKTE